MAKPTRRLLIKVEVEVMVVTEMKNSTAEMLALEASSHNEYDPDESSVLERKYGTAEVTNQKILSIEEQKA